MINLNINASSQTKGESLLDTVANLSAMQADIFVVRHESSGAPFLIARREAARARHQRRRRAAMRIRRRACSTSSPSGITRRTSALTVAIVGDILHSASPFAHVPRLTGSA